MSGRPSGPFLLTPRKSPADVPEEALVVAGLREFGYKAKAGEPWSKGHLPHIEVSVEEGYYSKDQVASKVSAEQAEIKTMSVMSKYLKVSVVIRPKKDGPPRVSWAIYADKRQLIANFDNVFPKELANKLHLPKAFSSVRMPGTAAKEIQHWCDALAEAINKKKVSPQHLYDILANCFLPEGYFDYLYKESGGLDAKDSTEDDKEPLMTFREFWDLGVEKAKAAEAAKEAEASADGATTGWFADFRSDFKALVEPFRRRASATRPSIEIKDVPCKLPRLPLVDFVLPPRDDRPLMTFRQFWDLGAKAAESPDKDVRRRPLVDFVPLPPDDRPLMTFRQFWDLGAPKSTDEALVEPVQRRASATMPTTEIKDVPCELPRLPLVDFVLPPRDDRPLMTFRQFWDHGVKAAA